MSASTRGRSRVRISLSTAASLALVLSLYPALSGSAATKPQLRLDPEVLSGRVAQYLLGESELFSGSSASPAAAATFGTDIQVSDEHLPKQLISQTEPTIAAKTLGNSYAEVSRCPCGRIDRPKCECVTVSVRHGEDSTRGRLP